MESTTFTVDAALLRELGERLVGRSYIALAELLKNSYDADATNCRIDFGADSITVSDNGHGMSEREFHEHWMRIGTTHKTAEKISRRFGRPMTGSKGLGRLSAQFLADKMTLESTSADEPSRRLSATVDWTSIRHGKGIGTFKVLWGMLPGQSTYPNGSRIGTRIVLKILRSKWGTDEIDNLGRNVWMLQSFRPVGDRRVGETSHDFYVDIDAPGIHRAKEAFTRVRDVLFDNWKALIRGVLVHGRSEKSSATVSVEFRKGYPEKVDAANSFREELRLPVDPRKSGSPAIDRAVFEIRVFKPTGRQPAGISVKDMRTYLHEFGNVSVYDSGFRLPYYGKSQDWLQVATDQGRRLTTSALLPSSLHINDRYLLDLPAPGRILGSVEIDTSHERRIADEHDPKPGKCLQISPGRDRLAENEAYDQLRDLVRFSLDFYANRYCRLRVDAAEKAGVQGTVSSRTYDRAIAVLEDNRKDISQTAYRDIRKELVAAKRVAVNQEELIDRRAEMLAPLATAGMTALALNHELAREQALLDRAREGVRAVATTLSASELKTIVDDLDAAADRIRALRQLFAPLLSGEDREATDRLRVAGVVRLLVHAFESLMPRVRFDTRRIPMQLRFPVGSFTEWSALLQNVVTNAWNAMLDVDRASISFEGGRGGHDREWLRISDTGVGLHVPLEESQVLFEPFERRLYISDENRSIAMGGQGLGLTIVRMIAHRRSARAAFVRTNPGFATTIENIVERSSGMKILVCDDIDERGKETLTAISQVEPGHETELLSQEELTTEIRRLFAHARSVLGNGDAAATDTENTPPAFGRNEFDIVILDNNLSALNIGGARHTAESIAGYVRAFGNIPYVVSLNKNPQVDFDLRHLIGDYQTQADLAVNGTHLSNRALWTGHPKDASDGFLPWYWPTLNDVAGRRQRQIRFVETHVDDHILPSMGFPPGAADSLSPHARERLSPQAVRAASVKFTKFFTTACRSLPIQKEREKLARAASRSDVERQAMLRVVAAELDGWVRRDLLGPQDLLVDLPHLLMRMPFLLGRDADDLGRWNETVVATDPPYGLSDEIYERHLKDAAFDLAGDWANSPCFWWRILKSDAELNRQFFGEESKWADVVFCEDLSRFVSPDGAMEFAGEFDGAWNRRHVARLKGRHYSPNSRLVK